MIHMELFLKILLLGLGIGLLIVGGNKLTDGAVVVARRLKMSDMLIGLTVVAAGSAMPDLVVCLTSTLSHRTPLALGDVVGGNMFDAMMVFGILAIMRPLKISRGMLIQDIPLMTLAAFTLFFCGDDILWDNGAADIIDRTDGLMLLSLFAIFMVLSFQSASAAKCPVPVTATTIPERTDAARARADSASGTMSFGMACVWVVAGLVALIVGGNFVVSGSTYIAHRMGLSESVIGLTVVALGNSAPDLAAAMAAMLRGKPGLALGTLVGGCIINAFFVLGLCATISPLHSGGISTVEYATLAGGSLVLWLLARFSAGNTIRRWGGILLVGIYVAYMTVLVINAAH